MSRGDRFCSHKKAHTNQQPHDEPMSKVPDNLNEANFNTVIQAVSLDDECRSALGNIDDDNLLVEIVTGVENQDIRIEAIKKITCENQLCKITEKNCGKTAGITAVDRIGDRSLLRRITEKASNKKVRLYALEKLKMIQGKSDMPSTLDLRETELKGICEAAERLADSWNWEYVINRLAEMRQTWKKLDPEWEHQLCGSFDAACESFFSRYEEFQSRQAEERRKKQERDQKITELESLCEEAEALSNGPTEDCEHRMQELTLQWQKASVISGEVFENLEYRFKRACQNFDESRTKSKEETKRREEIISELEECCEDAEFWSRQDDIKTADKKMNALSKKWNKITENVHDINDITNRFAEAVETFASRKRDYELELNRRYQDTLTQLTNICDRVEALIDAENRMDAERQVKTAQDEWKNLNKTIQLKNAERVELNRRFREAIERFHIRQNEFRDQQQWEQWANFTVKEGLCETLEDLEKEEDLFKVAGTLKKIKLEWNNAGPTPREKSDLIWNRYKSVCDRLYSRCKDFFDKLEGEQATNLRKKEEICDKIESLVTTPDWKNSISTIRSLQTQWRDVGPVHREKEEQINKRFRQACDQYFDGRRAHLKTLSVERQDNLRNKELLCEKVEALLGVDDIYLKIGEVKKYNEEWKRIGPADPKNENELWGRFRTACDRFFSKLDAARPENLAKKQVLIADVEKVLAGINYDADIELSELNRISQELISIQRQWKKIGRVPQENEQEIWERFNKPCNGFFTWRRKVTAKIEGEQDKLIAEKEKLLQELESLTESTHWKAASPEVNRIISDWRKIGIIPKTKDRKLERRFRKICDQFFEQKRAQLNKQQEERSVISRKKEELCVRMELLSGDQSAEKKENPDSSLSLSEHLKLAFESNFIAGSSRSDCAVSSWHNSFEEAKKIQKAWRNLGPSRGTNDKVLAERFRKACDVFYSKRPKPNQSNRS